VAGDRKRKIFEVDGAWRCSRRHTIVDLVGDLSQHMLWEL